MAELAYILGLTQAELKVVLYNYLREKNMSPMFEDGFVYAEGDIPVLLVAHMDTVFDEPPKNLYYDKKNDELFSYEGGIGGDDRCGVYAIMKILERFKPHVLFTEDEEIGGVGAEKTVHKLPKPDVKYIIEFDRKGNNDCVFYDCGNEDFAKYIESFGFVTNYGSFSDISVLGPAWDIAAVNISSGYYNEHTKNEYIKFSELQVIIKRIKNMIKNYENAKSFDFKEIIYSPSIYGNIFEDWTEEDFINWYNTFVVNDYFNKEENNKKLTLTKNDNNNYKKGDKI